MAAAIAISASSSETAAAGLLPLLLFPLVGAVLCGLFGRRLQRRFGAAVVPGIAIAAMLGAALTALVAFTRLLARAPAQRVLQQHLFPLLAVDSAAGPLQIDVALELDALAAVFVLVITLVGTLIHLYAAGYMRGDPGQPRFFAALNLFVFSMLLLVLGDSLLLCFFGWEGVGLCSYLLIGFWFAEPENARAARKAFIVNRIGDLGFVAGMLLLVVAVPTLRFHDLAAVAPTLAGARLWGLPFPFLVCAAFFLAMSGKSAQIPLYLWLPDAMAGPTPVSALIHAATMVTAGIYLAARLGVLFVLSPGAATLVAGLGLATALVGALLAMFQQDLKKVLAYSTISQLGYMFLAVGAGAPGAAVFHVVTHACFKACLFLAAGSVIHAQREALGHGHADTFDDAHVDARPLWPERRRRLAADPRDPQDMRNMGGLGSALPRTRMAYLVGALALAGLPVASGFFSKDEILARALQGRFVLVDARVFFAIGLVIAGLTAFYVARSYYLVFAGSPARPAADRVDLHEAPRFMTAPVLGLAAASILVGPLLGWPAAWGGHPVLERFLAPALTALEPTGDLKWSAAILTELAGIAVAIAGWMFGRALYLDRARSAGLRQRWLARFDGAHRVIWNRLGVDDLAQALIADPADDFSRAAAAIDGRLVDGLIDGLARATRGLAALGGWLDRMVVDGVVNGVAQIIGWAGRRAQRLQTGRLNHYTLGITVGTALIVIAAWIIR